ncbi:MAG: hypothetical protein ACNA8W_04790 [Bradymonadaceae bacterium]
MPNTSITKPKGDSYRRWPSLLTTWAMLALLAIAGLQGCGSDPIESDASLCESDGICEVSSDTGVYDGGPDVGNDSDASDGGPHDVDYAADVRDVGVLDSEEDDASDAGPVDAGPDATTDITPCDLGDLCWDIAHASYSEKSADISANTSNSRSVDFKPDGSKMYVVGRGTSNVAEYDLSTPWDVSTATYARDFDISGQAWVAHGLYFRKSDGLLMWVFNRTEIWEYTLSTAWNVTTAQQTGYRDVSSFVARGHDIDFKPDGTKLYIDDRDDSNVYQLALNTPWDVESAVLEYTLDISSEENAVRGIEFHPNGMKMYLMDTGRREVLEYHLQTAWEVETASFEKAFDVSTQSSDPRSITWKPDGTTFYITEASNGVVYQYSIE